MKRVALYVRVSTQEQKKHGLSVENQIFALREYCKEHNYIEAGLYSDAGISARKSYKKRPALLQLMEDCSIGKFDLILFTRIDRWFRSVADYYEVQRVLDASKIPWRAIWEDYETETSSGIFKVNIMLSIAQSESDRTSEKIKSVFEYKRAKGEYVGDVPFGYYRKNKAIYKDKEVEDVVAAIFNTYIKTHSSSACIDIAYKMGQNISRSGIGKMLKNPFYSCQSDLYEPYITPDEFAQITEIRKLNYRTPKNKNFYIFSTLCNCALCGKRMRTLTKNGKYRQYYCTGKDSLVKHSKGVYVSETIIEKYILENIESIVSEYNYNAQISSQSITAKEIELKKEKLAQKLSRVGVRFELGDISVYEYKQKREAIQNEIASLDVITAPKMVELPLGWENIYDDLDDNHKHQFWCSIIKRIEISPKNTQAPNIFFT